MATNVAVIRAVADTAGGTQDFTKSGFGTPSAAIFLWNSATADDTETADYVTGIGFTDDTNETAVLCYAEDNVGTTNVRRELLNTKVVQFRSMADADIGAADGVGATGGAITDGWRLDWTTTPTSAFLLTVILIKATNAHVNTKSGFLTASATDVTDPGFQANLIFFAEPGQGVGVANIHRFSIGAAAHNGTAWSQAASSHANRDAVGTTEIGSLVRNDECSMEILRSGFHIHGLKVTATNANGFTAQAVTANYGGDTVAYLALEMAETPIVLTMDSPDSASAAWAVTGAGFTEAAEFVFGGANAMTAYNTASINDTAGPYGIFAWTDDSEEFCVCANANDAATTTREKSNQSNNALLLRDADGATLYDFTSPTLDSEGWDITAGNITTASATTHKWWAALVESPAAAAPAPFLPYFNSKRPDVLLRM